MDTLSLNYFFAFSYTFSTLFPCKLKYEIFKILFLLSVNVNGKRKRNSQLRLKLETCYVIQNGKLNIKMIHANANVNT